MAALVSLFRRTSQWAVLALWCFITAARLQLISAAASAFLLPVDHTACRLLLASQQQQQRILYKRTKHDDAQAVCLSMVGEEAKSSQEEEEVGNSSTPRRSSTLKKKNKTTRWDSLNPSVKARIVKSGQERAIANKEKRESPQAKKRRMMMYMKAKQQEKKRNSRVRRSLSFADRTPLVALMPGMEVTGIVISLTDFGAYVDIGTECDGLLHVSQLSEAEFIQHPRQVLTPGEEVTVRVRSTNPEMKKLHLTMLSPETLEADKRRTDEAEDRIQLDELQVDDELWGELKRVTDYGAYVEVGAVVDGFLHFMDHPAFGWSKGSHPSTFMKRGDRVRVWVSDVDLVQRRIKLTANRPQYLPGPKRQLPI